MNIPDWIPDWRDPTQYPENASDLQWAWEFLRRNQDYQSDYERFKDTWKPPFILPIEMQHKYRLEPDSGLLDPSDSNTYTRVFYGGTPEKPETAVDYHLMFFGGDLGKVPGSKSRRPGQVSLTFDLTAPIAPQMKYARDYLAKLMRYQQMKPKFRNTKDKYQIYLRVLDAKFIGEKSSDIAEILFPLEPNGYPDFNGNWKVKDALKAARKMRDEGYAFLGAGWFDRLGPPSSRTIKILR